jgi:uncharacterized membrane protein YphA (DoxX/SURF4 family)
MKEKLGSTLLRIGLGTVFLLFGIGKFQNDYWARTMASMPFFEKLPWSTDISVLIAGCMEVLTGGCLVLGLWTRVFASLAAAQLVTILVLVQFQETRDIGLLGAALFMALAPDRSFGLLYFFNRTKNQ